MSDEKIIDDTITVPTHDKGDLYELLQADPEIECLVEKAQAFTVSTDEELGECSDLLKAIKVKKQQLFQAHKTEKAPILQQGRKIDRKYTLPKSLLVKAIKHLNHEYGTFMGELGEEADKEILQAEKEYQEEYAKAMAYAHEHGTEPKLPIPRIPKKAPKRVETGVSSTTLIKKTKIRIVDVQPGQEESLTRDDIRLANLPEKYFKIDLDALERDKKAGVYLPSIQEIVEPNTMTR